MKPTTFVITLIIALLIGWGLISYNRTSETISEASPISTPTATTPTENQSKVAMDSRNNTESATSGCKRKCCCKTVRTERFEPNTSSAPDHRPLF